MELAFADQVCGKKEWFSLFQTKIFFIDLDITQLPEHVQADSQLKQHVYLTTMMKEFERKKRLWFTDTNQSLSSRLQSAMSAMALKVPVIYIKSTCVRTLGYDDASTSICYNDLHKYKHYDPRDGASLSLPEGLQRSVPTQIFLPAWYFFGTFDYQNRFELVKEANIEDELQGFLGIQFLPYLNDFVDQEGGLPILQTQ